jgi:hypothetical protein
MWRRVALVTSDVSEQRIASIIRVTRSGELGTILTLGSNRSTLRRLVTANVVPCSPIVVNMMMQPYVPSKRRFLHEPKRVTFQKTAFLIVTAVETSNLS